MIAPFIRTELTIPLALLAAACLPAALGAVPESDFSKGLQWVGVACEDPDHTLWGASPVVSDDGKVHLFVARWPQANVDPAWRRHSEIARYTADRPEGPFTFAQVVLQGTGTDTWDKYAPCNPEIQRFEGRYVLLYIANNNYNQPPHPNNQQIGMATAPAPEGPWTKVGPDGLILGPSPDPGHFTHGNLLVNPTLLKVGPLYHLFFKTRAPGTVYGVATSPTLTGPYGHASEPLTPPGVTIEDACSFLQDGKVKLLTTDNHGDVTGVVGGGALWTSDNGFTIDPASTRLGFRHIPDYYPDYDPGKVTKVYGTAPKFERPKVLLINGRPRYFYAPSGWNVFGGPRTVVHVLRIDDPPAENPHSNLLRNGDFEQGTGIADANWGDTPDATKLPGWSWGSSVKIVRNAGNGTPGHGNGSSNLVSPDPAQQAAMSNNSSSTPPAAAVSLWQSFTTEPGTDYQISFRVGSISFASRALAITATVHDGASIPATPPAGTPLASLFVPRTGTGYGDPATFTFTAVSATSTLVFTETSANTNSADIALDQVSVRRVFTPPPPAINLYSPRHNGTTFSLDWRLSHGPGIDLYRTTNLADYQLLATNLWRETFTDPEPPRPAAFYQAVPSGGPPPSP